MYVEGISSPLQLRLGWILHWSCSCAIIPPQYRHRNIIPEAPSQRNRDRDHPRQRLLLRPPEPIPDQMCPNMVILKRPARSLIQRLAAALLLPVNALGALCLADGGCKGRFRDGAFEALKVSSDEGHDFCRGELVPQTIGGEHNELEGGGSVNGR